MLRNLMALKSSFFSQTTAANLLGNLHARCFSKAWQAKDFSDLLILPGTVAQVLEDESRPAGFSLYQIVGNEAEILTIGVVPELRRQKVGHTLLLHGESYLQDRGATRLLLEVSADNHAALRLYEKSGYDRIGTRKNYYLEEKKRVDAYIMVKSLA